MNSSFLSQVLNFFGIALTLYAIAQLYQWVSKDKVIKHTVKCKYCRKRISEKVGHRAAHRNNNSDEIG